MLSKSSLLKQAGFAPAQEGLRAAARGVPVGDCPYPFDDPNPAVRLKARFWRRGHARHVRRTSPVA